MNFFSHENSLPQLQMENKHIVRDNALYPGSPQRTLFRFQSLDTDKAFISTKEEELLLIFDVSFVEEHEMVISLPQPQLLQVVFKHGFKNTGTMSCSRDCTYTFKFPEALKVEDLIAQWTEDDFLVIQKKSAAESEMSDEPGKEAIAEVEKCKEASKNLPAKVGKSDEPGKVISAESEKYDEFGKETLAKIGKSDELSKVIPAKVAESDEHGKETSAKVGKSDEHSKIMSAKVAKHDELSKEIPAKVGKPDEAGKVIPAEVGKSDEYGKKILAESKNNRQIAKGNDVKFEVSGVPSELAAVEENFNQSQNRDTVGIQKIKYSKIELEASAKQKNVPRLVPHKVKKIYKPIVSAMELKSVMADIQNRMLFVKNFIDTYSFDTPIEQTSGAQVETKTLQKE